VLMFSVDLYI